MKNEIKHTAHSTYRCEYHIVFAPKYRRKEIYGQLKKDIGEIIRKLCNEKKVEIIEAEACPDHIHMLVSVPPYLSIAQFMGFLKGKSTLMIFDRHANLKYKYGKRSFWCRGYYVDTVTYFYGHFYCRGMIGCSIDIIMPASKILRYFTCVSKPSNTGFMLSNVKISLARKAA